MKLQHIYANFVVVVVIVNVVARCSILPASRSLSLCLCLFLSLAFF